MTDKREESQRRTPLQKLEDLNKAKPAAALLGLTIYGLARVSHDAFYAKLGVTVEEVGLDQGIILGRAALYFVFYLALAVSVGALGFAAAFSLQMRRSSSGPSSGRQAETSVEGVGSPPVDSTLAITILLGVSVPLVGIVAPQVLFTALRIPETDAAFVAKMLTVVALVAMMFLFFMF